MKSMPYTLKQKLRQYHIANMKAKQFHDEILEELEKYGVPYENLTASADNSNDEPVTEGLTSISYCEGDIEVNIAEIEEVFLYFANRSK